MKISKIQLAIYMNMYARCFATLMMAGEAPTVLEQKEIRDDCNKELKRIRKELWELLNK